VVNPSRFISAAPLIESILWSASPLRRSFGKRLL
jgi:hypothetical protein